MLREALELQILEQDPEQAAGTVGKGVAEHGASPVAGVLLEATALGVPADGGDHRRGPRPSRAARPPRPRRRRARAPARAAHRHPHRGRRHRRRHPPVGRRAAHRLGEQDLLFGAWLGLLTGLRVDVAGHRGHRGRGRRGPPPRLRGRATSAVTRWRGGRPAPAAVARRWSACHGAPSSARRSASRWANGSGAAPRAWAVSLMPSLRVDRHHGEAALVGGVADRAAVELAFGEVQQGVRRRAPSRASGTSRGKPVTPTATSVPCGSAMSGQLVDHLVGERVDGLVHLAGRAGRPWPAAGPGRRGTPAAAGPPGTASPAGDPPPRGLRGVAPDEHRGRPTGVDGEPRTDVHAGNLRPAR